MVKKVNIKSILIKTGVLVALVVAWNSVSTAVQPIIANNLAMMQMSNSVDSSAWIQIYSTAYNYQWLLFVLLVGVLYFKDIKNFIKVNKKENQNEEVEEK